MARGPIGIELVKRGIITQRDIDKALEYQKKNPEKKIIEILSILNLCDEYTLIKALGDILDEEAIILTQNDIQIDMLQYISLDIAKKYKAIPFKIMGNKIKECLILDEPKMMASDFLKAYSLIDFVSDEIIKRLKRSIKFEDRIATYKEAYDVDLTISFVKRLMNVIKLTLRQTYFELGDHLKTNGSDEQ